MCMCVYTRARAYCAYVYTYISDTQAYGTYLLIIFNRCVKIIAMIPDYAYIR
jgi:hypothetical protein